MKDLMDAKRTILKELKKQMSKDDSMGLDKILPSKLKKVTVMADSKKGLEEGLTKAQEILKKRLASKGLEEKEMEDESEDSEDMEDEMEDESEDMDESEECDCGECPMCLKEKITKLEDKLEK